MSVAFWLAADAWPVYRALRLDRAGLERLTRRRLVRLLASAAGSPFHRDRMRAVGIRDLRTETMRDPFGVLAAMPTSTKQELREAGSAALAGGRVGRGWRTSLSSGSTGEPFQVYYDPRAWATLKYLVKLRARGACGMTAGDRIGLLEAGRGGGTGRIRTISVLQPAEAVADELEALQPDVLHGLPSAMLEAARVIEARGGRLEVRTIFTGGELLESSVRQELSAAFGAEVFDIYGTSETKEIAWECPLGGMHVNADVLRVEVLGDAGEVVPAGAEGDIVATVLVNHAMPLLRYRTGDRGSLIPDRCPCGLDTPLLGVVTGRAADVLVLAGGQRVSPYMLTCALERVGSLARYQVEQLAPTRLGVRAVLASGADATATADRIRSALRSGVAGFIETEVEFVDRLPTGPRAKFRVVQPSATAMEHP